MANQYTKKKLISQQNRKEIFWNLLNSGLAGALVFLGSLTSGKITWQGLVFGLIASAIVIITKFKDYWDGEKKEYSTKLFKFL
ncbi:MAG: hypothetical protein WC711_04205 [Candidatus Staskawiczbacteria bacterium]|jgi:hypothetical protein